MAENSGLSYDRRLRNHFNIDKRRRSNSHRQTAPHVHSYYELYYMQEGACRVFVLDRLYEMHKGDLLLIAPGEYHIVTYEQKGLHDRYTVYFDSEKLPAAVLAYLPFLPGEGQRASHFLIPPVWEEEMNHLLTRLLEYYRTNTPLSELMVDRLFQVFMLYLGQHAVMVDPAVRQDATASAVENAARFITARFQEDLTLEEVAAQAGFTPSYFSRKFKEVTGVGFRDLLLHTRLLEAERLLRTTTLSVTDISRQCGFSSGNYFGDAFRSLYHMSPRQYRKGTVYPELSVNEI